MIEIPESLVLAEQLNQTVRGKKNCICGDGAHGA